MGKIPTGLWSRGTKLVGLASKMAMNELASMVKDEKAKLESKMELAQSMVKTLSELKGASMKLGQLMSMDLGEYLPPEVIKVLETLHQNSTFLPYEKIEAILKEELKEKFSEIKNISSTPLAAASIGQVHTAELNGKKIVLKVQYPGVADSIPSDLKMLKIILSNVSLLQGKDIDLGPFLQEVEEVLKKETDYVHECRMLQAYIKSFDGSPYIVPEVYADFSTNTVLAMEFIEGKPLLEWASKAFLGERQKKADEFMHLYLKEFFSHGLVQTDPNPGNFMITPDNRVALLDFGAVKEYQRDFIEGYRRVLMAAHKQDKEVLLLESQRMNFLDSRESDEVKDLYFKMMDTLAAPFRKDGPFDFGDKKFYEESKELTWTVTRKCKYSPPPKDLLFLHRKLAGVFVLIKKLDVQLELKSYWPIVEGKKV